MAFCIYRGIEKPKHHNKISTALHFCKTESSSSHDDFLKLALPTTVFLRGFAAFALAFPFSRP